MIAMSRDKFGEATNVNAVSADCQKLGVQETFWGYIIHSDHGWSAGMVIGQVLAWLGGLSLAIAAIGLWIVSGPLQDSTTIVMRLGASALMAGMSVLLLWYASRGTAVEVQVDTRKGEVREVVRNRAGRPTIIGRYGFDSIGGTFLDRRNAAKGEADLVLRYRNTTTLVTVAHGPIVLLECLKDRLGRDLLLDQTGSSRRTVVEPQPIAFHLA